MRIFMQTANLANEAPKYYQLTLQQDLLGGWTLLREWGQPGMRSSAKRDIFLEREDAEKAFEHTRDQQVKKGFRVMFTRGSERNGD